MGGANSSPTQPCIWLGYIYIHIYMERWTQNSIICVRQILIVPVKLCASADIVSLYIYIARYIYIVFIMAPLEAYYQPYIWHVVAAKDKGPGDCFAYM